MKKFNIRRMLQAQKDITPVLPARTSNTVPATAQVHTTATTRVAHNDWF